MSVDALKPELISDPATDENVCALEARIREMETRLTNLEARQHRDEMRESGYIQTSPPLHSFAYGIDQEVCSEARCDSCGLEGMLYEPWWNQEGHSYRAFAVCPRCHWREEF